MEEPRVPQEPPAATEAAAPETDESSGPQSTAVPTRGLGAGAGAAAGLAGPPALTPLLLRTFGRTGSTLLMQLLATSPRVCLEREYPFEHRFLTYVQQLARVAALPYKQNPTWNNMQMFHGHADLVGALPYESTRSLSRRGLCDRLLASLWRDFSISMRDAAGLDHRVAAFYAEKVPERLCEPAHRLLGGRSIFLLRDPRDELVSIMSFNAKRGFLSFGWQEDDTEESYAERMIESRGRFAETFVAMRERADPSAITVRYEDLVSDGEGEAARLSEWLGLRFDYARASSDGKVRSAHMTSRDPARSVGRWREELGERTRAIFVERMGPQLEAAGYALS